MGFGDIDSGGGVRGGGGGGSGGGGGGGGGGEGARSDGALNLSGTNEQFNPDVSEDYSDSNGALALPNNSLPRRNSLNFRLSNSTADGSVREYVAQIDPDPSIIFNFPTFAYTVIREGLIKIIRNLLSQIGLGLKIYFDVNCIFARTISKNQDEFIYVPFRQKSVVYSVNDVTFISECVNLAVQTLLDKCETFQELGSGWVLSSIISLDLYVANLNHNLGEIGARRNISRRNLFSHFSSGHHECSDGTLILNKIIWSACESNSFCFPMAVIAHLYSWSDLKSLCNLRKNDAILFKQEMLSRAFSTYDFSNIEHYPIKFSDIELFMRANQTKIMLNVIGLSQTPADNTRQKKIKVWPVLRSPDLINNPKSLPIIHLVILREISGASELPRYHMGFCRDFDMLLSRAKPVDARTGLVNYCLNCFSPVLTEHFMAHKKICSSEAESLSLHKYNPAGEKLQFKYGKKRTSPFVYGVFDLETALIKDTSGAGFGPLGQVKGKYQPVSFAFQTVLNIENKDPNFRLLVKSYAGPDVMHKLFKQILFEATYCQSILVNLNYPIAISRAQSEQAAKANSCANCLKYLQEGGGVFHHNHHVRGEGGGGSDPQVTNYRGKLCQSCNSLYKRSNEDAFCLYAHNLSFEAAFILRECTSPQSSDLFETIRVYTKRSDIVSSMKLTFRCPLCFPDLILSNRLSFLVPSGAEKFVNTQLDQEFLRAQESICQLREYYRTGSQGSQPRCRLADEDVLANICEEQGEDDSEEEDKDDESVEDAEEEYEEEDEEEDKDEEEQEMSEEQLAQFSAQAVSDAVAAADAAAGAAVKKKKQLPACNHGKKWRTIQFRCSLAISCASLEKTTKGCGSTFQPLNCNESPETGGGFWLGNLPKSCLCCKDKYLMKSEGGVLCEFALNYFNDIKIVNLIFKKQLFCYDYLAKLINEDGSFNYSVLRSDVPPKSAFINQLSDQPCEPSESSYNDLMTTLSTLNLRTFSDLILLYNSLDVLTCIVSLAVINRFYYEATGLAVLRFNSLSSFAFEFALRSCSERVGVRGVEFLHNECQRLFLSQASSGGLQHCSQIAGKLQKLNNVDLPHFDPMSDQTKIIALDVNSEYPFVMRNCAMPQSDYYLHRSGDELIVQMNQLLQEKGSNEFISHYDRIVRETSSYYLLSVEIHFPAEIHDSLDVVPVARKRVISAEELSPLQKVLMQQLGINANSFKEPVVVSDLYPQTVTVSFSYLSVLVQVGVQITKINEVMSAFGAYIFKDSIQKLMDLKRYAKNRFFRQLAKNASNMSYGRMNLQNANYEVVSIAKGTAQIAKKLASPYLKRFKILSDNTVITYSNKQFAICNSLHFVGVAIQNESKAYLLGAYYNHIKAILAKAYLKYSLTLQTYYVDTDCLFFYCSISSSYEPEIHLKTSDILYALRNWIDFGPFLEVPHNRLFIELRARLTSKEYEDFMKLAVATSGQEGLFKIEHQLSEYFSEPIFFYSLKSKSYILQCYSQDTPDEDSGVIVDKKVLKGPILKSRLANLDIKDFLSMGKSCSKVLETKLTKINSKNWDYFLIEMSRHRPNCFDRKRFLVSLSGHSRAFGHFRNNQP